MRLLICTQAADLNDPILGFFHRWIEEFATHCEHVIVVCLFEGEHTFPSNVEVISLGKEKLSRHAREEQVTDNVFGKIALRLHYGSRVLRVAWRRRRDYDAVFVHMNPEYIAVAGILWKLLGKNVALWYTHKATPFLLRFSLLFVDRVFTASSSSFRIPSPKVLIMGHGVDISRDVPMHTPSQGVLRLITSGRITPIKKVDILIDAFLLLKKRNPTCTFVVAGGPVSPGDQEYREKLMQRLTEAKEDPNTVLIGAVKHSEMPRYRAQADYFIHASETGSLDKVVLDAILSDLIPLSSSEANAELFSGYGRWLSYPPGDSSALADKVMALAALPEEKRTEIRETLKKRVKEHHGLEQLIGRIVTDMSV